MTSHFYCPTPEATTALAARIAAHLASGDALLLHGVVGAGKSHFTRGLIRSLLPDATRHEDIPSPTFTLVQTYDAADGTPIWHADLYRLGSDHETEDLGFSQAFDEAIVLVEWPQKLGGLTPSRHLDVTLTQSRIDDDARCVSIEPSGDNWGWLNGLQEDRAALRTAFLVQTGWSDAETLPITDDASNRSYARLKNDDKFAVLMDAPPSRNEDTRPFVAVGAYLRELGYSAPDVFESDPENGFLLLEDLGDDLFARVLSKSPHLEAELYANAVDLLVDLQGHAIAPILPPYSASIYQRESQLVLDWYLDRPDLREAFRAALNTALSHLSDGLPVTILRDYHSENLLWLPERAGLARVGLLDFQDALAGHPAYDLVSLLEDARRDVSDDVANAMKQRFAKAKGMDLEDVTADCAILGAQRNAKILGLFVRFAKLYDKPQYLALIPRVLAHFQRDLAHPACAELRAVMAQARPSEFAL